MFRLTMPRQFYVGGADQLTSSTMGAETTIAAGCGNDTINDFDVWAVGGRAFIDVSAFGINAGNFAARVTIIDFSLGCTGLAIRNRVVGTGPLRGVSAIDLSQER